MTVTRMKSMQQHLIPYTSSAQRAKLFQQSGYRQSYSGSETDVSTSTENLTHEEKYVLRSSTRQEPQGEETLTGIPDSHNCALSHEQVSHHGVDAYDNVSKLCNPVNLSRGMVPSYLPKEYYEPQTPGNIVMNTQSQSSSVYIRNDNPRAVATVQHTPTGSSSRTTLSIQQRRSSLYGQLNEPGHFRNPNQNSSYGNAGLSQMCSPSVTSVGGYIHRHNHHSYVNLPHSFEYQPQIQQEVTEIPKHHLDQSEVLKHLAREVQVQGGNYRHISLDVAAAYDSSMLPPPPEYPRWQQTPQGGIPIGDCGGIKEQSGTSSEGIGTPDKSNSLSRSQPDLSRIGLGRWDESGIKTTYLSQRPKPRGQVNVTTSEQENLQNAAEIIDLLSAENIALRQELDSLSQKVIKLEKLELELQKVQESHEELVKIGDKRERMEGAFRARLEKELQKTQEINKDLKDQLEAATSPLLKEHVNNLDESEFRKELTRRDVFIAQLITQNKELVASKERQEIELAAQRATLQEQRTHIDILDTALTNAQDNVLKLEEENRKKQIFVERVGKLQQALASVQLASEKRVQMEKRLRSQVEKQLQELRQELKVIKEGKQSESGDSCSRKSASEASKELLELRSMINERDERIITLEAEVSRWEQRYTEESAMRQLAIDAASMPKDAKIAALERTSQESEKLIAQARSEKLKQMDELHASNKKCADLDSRVRDLESRLAERDAMIKVLQRHSLEKEVVYQNAILRSPRHTPHSSSVTIHHAASRSTSGLITSNACKSSVLAACETTCETNASSPSAATLTRSLSGPVLMRDADADASLCQVAASASPIPATSVPGSALATKKKYEEEKSSLDEELRCLDSQLLSKDSLIHALRAEKEKFPNHYWQV